MLCIQRKRSTSRLQRIQYLGRQKPERERAFLDMNGAALDDGGGYVVYESHRYDSGLVLTRVFESALAPSAYSRLVWRFLASLRDQACRSAIGQSNESMQFSPSANFEGRLDEIGNAGRKNP